MSTTEETDLTDDEILAYTQRHRRKFVGQFTQEGENYPKDPKEAKVLLTALSDMDRTALGKKRIKSEEDIATMNAQSVDAIASELRKTLGSTVFRPPGSGEAPREAPTIDDSRLPPLEIAEGETSIGIQAQTHEEFAAEYEKTHGKPQRRQD